MSDKLDDSRVSETDKLLAARFSAEESQVKRGPGRPKSKQPESTGTIANVWTQAVCAAIVAKQILSPSDVHKATAIADVVVEAFTAKFK